jgi:hypothetical protein
MTLNFAGGEASQYVTFSLAIGVAGIDRKNYDRYKPNDFRGTPVYDDNFDISSPAAQAATLQICDEIRKWPCVAEGCTADGFATLMRPNSLICFMEQVR